MTRVSPHWTVVLIVFLTSGIGCAELSQTLSETSYPLWNGRESVEAYAKRVNLPATKRLDIGNGVALDMVLIPAGTFRMGTAEPPEPKTSFMSVLVLFTFGVSLGLVAFIIVLAKRVATKRLSFSLRVLMLMTTAGGLLAGSFARWHQASIEDRKYFEAKWLYDHLDSDEKPAHDVTLTRPFYMSKHLVTQSQTALLLPDNPYLSTAKGANLPADCADWYDADTFCKRLGLRSVVPPESGTFALPTEAQWEFACRAGTSTSFNTGNGLGKGEANFDCSDAYMMKGATAISLRKTTPIGSYAPNAFGLYDMHGNVRQWCADWFADDYYAESPATDPTGPEHAQTNGTRLAHRVHRGGCWSFQAYYCRSAARGHDVPNLQQQCIGFRIVLNLPRTESK